MMLVSFATASIMDDCEAVQYMNALHARLPSVRGSVQSSEESTLEEAVLGPEGTPETQTGQLLVHRQGSVLLSLMMPLCFR